MNKIRLIYGFLFTTVIVMSNAAYAASLGSISGNILGPARGLGYLMNSICYLAGFGFLLCSLLQYKYHRENPQQVKLGTPVMLLFLGIALIAVPVLAMMSETASFLK